MLQALARGVGYGFDIMDFTGLPSGTTYPILRRFEVERLVRSRWEDGRSAAREGRPARRYYELTAAGRKALGAALERYGESRLLPDKLPALEPESNS